MSRPLVTCGDSARGGRVYVTDLGRTGRARAALRERLSSLGTELGGAGVTLSGLGAVLTMIFKSYRELELRPVVRGRGTCELVSQKTRIEPRSISSKREGTVTLYCFFARVNRKGTQNGRCKSRALLIVSSPISDFSFRGGINVLSLMGEFIEVALRNGPGSHTVLVARSCLAVGSFISTYGGIGRRLGGIQKRGPGRFEQFALIS